MESQYKGSSNGDFENGAREEEVAVANKRNMRGWDVVLRFLALALSLAAAVVVGVDKQTAIVELTLVPTLPALNVPVTAKWQHLSSFVFFLAANAIACVYAIISLLLTLANRGGKKGITMMIVIFDLVMVALLYSSVGAAVAIGLMGYEGNSRMQWKKVCNDFGKFCGQGAAAFAISGGAALAFFSLVVLATLNLHKKR